MLNRRHSDPIYEFNCRILQCPITRAASVGPRLGDRISWVRCIAQGFCTGEFRGHDVVTTIHSHLKRFWLRTNNLLAYWLEREVPRQHSSGRKVGLGGMAKGHIDANLQGTVLFNGWNNANRVFRDSSTEIMQAVPRTRLKRE